MLRVVIVCCLTAGYIAVGEVKVQLILNIANKNQDCEILLIRINFHLRYLLLYKRIYLYFQSQCNRFRNAPRKRSCWWFSFFASCTRSVPAVVSCLLLLHLCLCFYPQIPYKHGTSARLYQALLSIVAQ